MTHHDGSKFMEKYEKRTKKRGPNEPRVGLFPFNKLILYPFIASSRSGKNIGVVRTRQQ